MIYAFTSAALNYLPKVLMLADSLKKFHPEIHFCFSVVDNVSDGDHVVGEAIDSVIPVEELDIPNIRSWVFRHELVELATAVKPFVLKQLLEKPDCDGVFYFDPDMVLFSRLDDLIEDLQSTSILLTPHQLAPDDEIDAIIDNEICSLKHGVFNLGFVGVRPTKTGHDFADWWSRRLMHFCKADIPNGLFTDQKWIDLVPAFFEDHLVERSTRFNVASWNLSQREVTGDREEGVFVDGEPLGFYHFTGFDSGDHRVMAVKNGGKNPSVMSLIDWYEENSNRDCSEYTQKTDWTYKHYSTGEVILPLHRRIYDDRVDLQHAFPDPFGASTADSFFNWITHTAPIEYPSLFDDEDEKQPSEKESAPSIELSRIEPKRSFWNRLAYHTQRTMKDSRHFDYVFASLKHSFRAGGLSGLFGRVFRPRGKA